MPTYEYACTECGERVEVVQKISDPPLQMCGVCGGKLRKLFHPVNIAFKGSGFYTTDSRKGGRSGETKKREAKEKKPETSGTKESSEKKASA